MTMWKWKFLASVVFLVMGLASLFWFAESHSFVALGLLLLNICFLEVLRRDMPQ